MKTIAFSIAVLALILSSGCTYQLPDDKKPQVKIFTDLAQQAIHSSEFERVLAKMTAADFDHSANHSLRSDDGTQVLGKLKSKQIEGVICRRAVNPFNKSTNAWEGGGTPKLRCARFGKRDNEKWAGTVIHEMAHAVGYRHNGNGRGGNQCTVPNVVGDLTTYILYYSNGSIVLPEDACDALKLAIEAT